MGLHRGLRAWLGHRPGGVGARTANGITLHKALETASGSLSGDEPVGNGTGVLVAGTNSEQDQKLLSAE